MTDYYVSPEQQSEIRDWFDTWGGYVASVDYVSARQLFHPDVIGFGTYMEYVRGLENLEQQQWRSIWGKIEGFTFLTDRLVCGVDAAGVQAWGIVPWTSTGFHPDGSPYDRPGRATVIFTRDTPTDPWLAIHTHISLAPGTPQGAGVEPQE